MSKAYTGRNGEMEFVATKVKAIVYFVRLPQPAEADGMVSTMLR